MQGLACGLVRVTGKRCQLLHHLQKVWIARPAPLKSEWEGTTHWNQFQCLLFACTTEDRVGRDYLLESVPMSFDLVSEASATEARVGGDYSLESVPMSFVRLHH